MKVYFTIVCVYNATGRSKRFFSVQGYKHPQEYIATQGPLPETRNDFWKMVLQEKCPIVVMLTQCNERRRVSFVSVCRRRNVRFPALGHTRRFKSAQHKWWMKKHWGQQTLYLRDINSFSWESLWLYEHMNVSLNNISMLAFTVVASEWTETKPRFQIQLTMNIVICKSWCLRCQSSTTSADLDGRLDVICS